MEDLLYDIYKPFVIVLSKILIFLVKSLERRKRTFIVLLTSTMNLRELESKEEACYLYLLQRLTLSTKSPSLIH